jgi:hypothetical protein
MKRQIFIAASLFLFFDPDIRAQSVPEAKKPLIVLPFVKSYVPLLPNTALHVGAALPILK